MVLSSSRVERGSISAGPPLRGRSMERRSSRTRLEALGRGRRGFNANYSIFGFAIGRSEQGRVTHTEINRAPHNTASCL
jgi:hypothetical protein